MIKVKKTYDIDIKKTWGTETPPPLFKDQADITGKKLYFPNIIITSQKGSGKTVLAINLIKKFATNKTRIIIFSTTFLDGDDKYALKDIQNKYPGMIQVYKKIIDKENDNLSKLIDELKERYSEIENKKKKYSHTFPNAIILFDDLGEDDMKADSLDYLFRINRHIGTINILIQHRINTVATTTMRDNTDIICIFKGMSKDQLKYIFDMVNLPNISLKQFLKAYSKALENGDNNFLFINKTNGELRKNLSDIIYIE